MNLIEKLKWFEFKNRLFSLYNNPILHNKFLLYFLLLASLANLFYFTTQNDYDSIILFILISAVIMTYNKNMVIVLFVAFVLTNIVSITFKKRVAPAPAAAATSDGTVGNGGNSDNKNK